VLTHLFLFIDSCISWKEERREEEGRKEDGEVANSIRKNKYS
jgi:hypothetical protein